MGLEDNIRLVVEQVLAEMAKEKPYSANSYFLRAF
jgi:hypothetical protein